MADSDDAPVPSGPRVEQSIAGALEQAWQWSKAGKHPQQTGRDGFPVYADDPLSHIQTQLSDYLGQIRVGIESWKADPKKLPSGAALLALPAEQKLATLRAIVVRLLFHERQKQQKLHAGGWLRNQFHLLNRLAILSREERGIKEDSPLGPDEFASLAGELLRTDLPFTEADLVAFLQVVQEQRANDFFQDLSNEGVTRALERYAARGELSPALRDQLENWRKRLQSGFRVSSPARKLVTRINDLLGQGRNSRIEPGEAWSNAALDDLRLLPAAECARWLALLQHCQRAETSKPTQKWSKAARELVDAIGAEAFKRTVVRWFELIRLPRPIHQEPKESQWQPDPDQLINNDNSVILKGLAWCCADYPDAEVSRALGEMAQACFKKVRNLGPRCPRVGNACLYSLSSTASEHAAAQLCRLDQVVKQPSARKLLGKSLNKAAQISGQTREDLEESTVPTYGLDADGSLEQQFGSHTAEDPESRAGRGEDSLFRRPQKIQTHAQRH
jgi:hypothetical protein